MQNNITATWQQLDAVVLNTPLKLVNEHFNLSSTQSFTLPKDWTLELSGFYYSKSMYSIYTVSPFGSLNAGIQKKFPKHRSSIRFNVSNILNTMAFKPSINLPGDNIISHAQFDFSYPSLKLTFSHNFGSTKVKEKREHATGDEDEKARVH
jgi:hypothetical protein